MKVNSKTSRNLFLKRKKVNKSFLKRRYLNLRMSFTSQGVKSSNCGPCSIKMLADYYNIKHPSGELYSLSSLNRLCQVRYDLGCERSDMNRVLRRLGLKRIRVTWKNYHQHLRANRPILALFQEETGCGHYAVIKGVKNNGLIFHDSFWGHNYWRNQQSFKKQLQFFNNWFWAIEREDRA